MAARQPGPRCVWLRCREDPTWSLKAGGLPGTKCLRSCMGTIPGSWDNRGPRLECPPKWARDEVIIWGELATQRQPNSGVKGIGFEVRDPD